MTATGVAGLVDELVAVQRERAVLDARELELLARIAGEHVQVRQVLVESGSVTLEDEVREEIAAALGRSPGAVHEQIVTARLLAGPLRATREALAGGAITLGHARVIVEQARRMSMSHSTVHGRPEDDTVADAVDRAAFARACLHLQERVLPVAQRSTTGRTRTAARRAVAVIDAAGQERRQRSARAAIDVHVYPDDDGLAVLLARLPLVDAARVHAALDSHAHACPPDDARTVGQRRADALVTAVCGGTDTAQGSTVVGVEVQVTIDLASLMAVTDHPGSLSMGSGQEPVTAQAVRELLADPATPVTLRRLVVDPVTGHLLDRGRRTYAVTGDLREYLIARDRTCRFPGCARQARACDVDHAHPWDDGGATDRCNLGPLCRRHHLIKTHGDWQITESRDDGTCTWRSPLGHDYDSDPPPY